jgi:hypothetical protein
MSIRSARMRAASAASSSWWTSTQPSAIARSSSLYASGRSTEA